MHIKSIITSFYPKNSADENIINLLDSSVLYLRVLPTDIDIYGQMRNSRYITAMCSGYNNLIYKIGLRKLLQRQNWKLHIRATNTRYFSPVKIFQRYKLATNLLCWDNQWFYIEQRFRYKERLLVIIHIKMAIYGKSNQIAPGYFLELLGYDPNSPVMPNIIKYWKHFS